ncbi:MAG: thrombospondin type 3 repeat-containing protein [Myxococcota bacterium]
MRRLALALSLLAGPAWATATYPTAIKNHLGLAVEPPQSCGICHRNNVLGAGTVTTPFGTNMRMRGLMPNNEATLRSALDQLDTDMVDSDGDGVTDIAELRAGTDPNVGSTSDGGTGGGGGGTGGGAGGGGDTVAPLRYGCGANVAPGLSLFAALLVGLRLRRRR